MTRWSRSWASSPTAPRRAGSRWRRPSTRYLESSLPYRLLFQRQDARSLREPMLDALVDLLGPIHLVGFRWGIALAVEHAAPPDAGTLSAYLVDTEAGELHDERTAGDAGEP